MDVPRHSRDECLIIASISGAVQRLIRHPDQEAAIAELRTHTTEPHLLAHGALLGDDPLGIRDRVRALLLKAGATEPELDRVQADFDARYAGRRPIPGLNAPAA